MAETSHALVKTPIALRQLPLLARAPDGARPLLAVTLPSAAPRARAGLSLSVKLPGAARFELVPFETAQGELRFTVPPRTRGRVTARVHGLDDAPNATVACEVGDDPDAHRTLLIVASAHTDLGYTAAQEQVAEAHAQNIATALELHDADDAFVWNLECLWQLDMLRELRGAKLFQQAIDAIRERRLGASALYLLMLPGMLSRPMLSRYTDFARELRRKFRLPLLAATLTDVPTAVPSWPSLLREAGVRWLIHGVNNYCAMPWRPEELAGRPGPVRWVAPDGQSVVVQFARWPQDRPAFGPGYAQLQALGLAGDGVVNLRVADSVRAVELFLRDHSAAPRGVPLLVHGAYFENARLTERLPKTVAAFRAKYAAPEIRFTTAEGFFREALGDDLDGRALPIVRGGGGAYWESGIASTARETGWFREAMERFETLETVAPRSDEVRRDAAIRRPLVLFGEHTWGAAESVTKPDSEASRYQLRWKMQRLAQARRTLASATRDLARAAVTRSTRSKSSKSSQRGATLVLFRAERTAAAESGDLFECTVPRGTTPAGLDGRPLPAAVVARFAGHERLLVRSAVGLARGANRFALVDASANRASTVVSDRATRGRFARPVRVSSLPLSLIVGEDGRIDLEDSATGAPLTDRAAPFGLGDWIHAAGGDRSRLVHTEWIDGAMTFYEAKPELSLARAIWKTRRVTLTPLGPRIELAGAAPFTPRVRLALQLHSNLPRVDLELFVVRTANRAKEAAYVALPFALKRPRLVYDAAGTPCDFERDLLPGAARDWIAVGRWLRLDARGTRPPASASLTRSVTVVPREAALFTVGDVFRGEWAARRAPSSRLFAYVMNNYWPTNYAAEQRGAARFRFTIHFGHFDPSRASGAELNHVAARSARGGAT